MSKISKQLLIINKPRNITVHFFCFILGRTLTLTRQTLIIRETETRDVSGVASRVTNNTVPSLV